MKKQLKVLLIALLIVPCVFMLIACGKNGTDGKDLTAHIHIFSGAWTEIISPTCTSQV